MSICLVEKVSTKEFRCGAWGRPGGLGGEGAAKCEGHRHRGAQGRPWGMGRGHGLGKRGGLNMTEISRSSIEKTCQSENPLQTNMLQVNTSFSFCKTLKRCQGQYTPLGGRLSRKTKNKQRSTKNGSCLKNSSPKLKSMFVPKQILASQHLIIAI